MVGRQNSALCNTAQSQTPCSVMQFRIFGNQIILDPLESFAASEGGLANLISSAGVSIWQETTPYEYI